jgi:2-hydroxychromene-2-carboxylate isomerase
VGALAAEPPVFYYDVGSPYAWLCAERINAVLPRPPVWQPILLGGLFKIHDRRSWAQSDEREAGMREVERRAAAYGLGSVCWPEPWPGNTLFAMRAATFAARAGKAVSFSLAAFRQAYAGGRDLSDPDNVLIAGAACELHPRALLAGAQTQATKERLKHATEEAARLGVVGVPSVSVGGEVFWGDDRLEEVATRMAEAR